MRNLFLILIFIAPFYVLSQPKNGSRAIDFTITDMNGKEVSLSDYRGKIVLLDFWASWCGPCRHENPNVVEAYNKYRKTKFKNAKGFVVLNVSLDRSEKPWKEAIKKDGLYWKSHMWDQDHDISKKYGIRSIPYGFLIDGEGKIISQGAEIRGIGLHIEIEKLMED